MEMLDESREVVNTTHEQDQNMLSGLEIPSGFGSNTPFDLKVKPRILEFQPVGVNDSNRARYIAFASLVSEAERYVSALVPFFA
ncbi:hypothetical protein HYPSUDRAFT_43501 [Hypholoma sublateritium FD-334 SS-4]|uniref:Uncharacterized protein n=1 Tax=Hypholoma sublateritium (strain FD-334 SS-4) TaxID=945553 RepID=A0A0D2M9Y4_HYPSF|nr:hypothetical protein HYPSUDRAFT_43501 [Hypholoma sublateritium FD-334 SS-4]